MQMISRVNKYIGTLLKKVDLCNLIANDMKKKIIVMKETFVKN